MKYILLFLLISNYCFANIDLALINYFQPEAGQAHSLRLGWHFENFAKTNGEKFNVSARVALSKIPTDEEGDEDLGDIYTLSSHLIFSKNIHKEVMLDLILGVDYWTNEEPFIEYGLGGHVLVDKFKDLAHLKKYIDQVYISATNINNMDYRTFNLVIGARRSF